MLGWHTQCNSEQGKNDSKGALYCAISWRAQRDSQNFNQDIAQFKYHSAAVKGELHFTAKAHVSLPSGWSEITAPTVPCVQPHYCGDS